MHSDDNGVEKHVMRMMQGAMDGWESEKWCSETIWDNEKAVEENTSWWDILVYSTPGKHLVCKHVSAYDKECVVP